MDFRNLTGISTLREEKPSLDAAVSMMKNFKKEDPKKPNEEEITRFGNFAGEDTMGIAKDLARRGMVGASQLLTDHPDISSKSGIVNAQSDWKPSAISSMLMQAKRLGLKTPTEIAANKEALMGKLDPRYKEALNHQTFNQIHPNFWETFNGILKDQYAKETL